MKGKLPFPDWILVTPVKVYQVELGEDGESKDLLFEGLCFHDEKSKQVLDAERRLVTLSGKVIIKGDIHPGEEIHGFVQFGNAKKDIHRAARPHNPDGSVFSTELDLS